MRENRYLYYTLALILLICSVLHYCPPEADGEKTVNAGGNVFTAGEAPAVAAPEQESKTAPPNTLAGTCPWNTGAEELMVLQVQMVREAIAYDTEHREDGSLEKGRIMILEEGREGVKELTLHVFYCGGMEIYRETVGETVMEEPRNAVVAVGTRPRAPLPVASRQKAVLAYQEEGIASWYGADFQGNLTTSGEAFDKNEFTAAHLTLPFGTLVKVTFLRNGREVVVRINDRGPHIKGRIIDLSRAAAAEIGLKPYGVGKVRIEVVE